jgi:hypothetical protein
LTSYRKALGEEEFKFLLAIVIDSDMKVKLDFVHSVIEKYKTQFGDGFEIRVFSLNELMIKYGFPLADEEDDAAPAE